MSTLTSLPTRSFAEPERNGGTPRSQWTIKSRKLTPELRTEVRAAARKVGMPQGDYVVARLRDSVRADLSGKASSAAETESSPQRIEELAAAVEQLHAKIDRLQEQKTPVRQIVDGVLGLIWG